MDKALEQLVRNRAAGNCEYCRRPQFSAKLKFPIDHITARQHGGEEVAENLALCCGRCNRHKGPNIAGVDPVTGLMTRLFHPRQDTWTEHFSFDGPLLEGLTPIDRATVRVLNINNVIDLAARQSLISEGRLFQE